MSQLITSIKRNIALYGRLRNDLDVQNKLLKVLEFALKIYRILYANPNFVKDPEQRKLLRKRLQYASAQLGLGRLIMTISLAEVFKDIIELKKSGSRDVKEWLVTLGGLVSETMDLMYWLSKIGFFVTEEQGEQCDLVSSVINSASYGLEVIRLLQKGRRTRRWNYSKIIINFCQNQIYLHYCNDELVPPLWAYTCALIAAATGLHQIFKENSDKVDKKD